MSINQINNPILTHFTPFPAVSFEYTLNGQFESKAAKRSRKAVRLIVPDGVENPFYIVWGKIQPFKVPGFGSQRKSEPIVSAKYLGWSWVLGLVLNPWIDSTKRFCSSLSRPVTVLHQFPWSVSNKQTNIWSSKYFPNRFKVTWRSKSEKSHVCQTSNGHYRLHTALMECGLLTLSSSTRTWISTLA